MGRARQDVLPHNCVGWCFRCDEPVEKGTGWTLWPLEGGLGGIASRLICVKDYYWAKKQVEIERDWRSGQAQVLSTQVANARQAIPPRTPTKVLRRKAQQAAGGHRVGRLRDDVDRSRPIDSPRSVGVR